MHSSGSPLKPRKAPRQSRARETYASILEAAALILEGLGFEAFNTNSVAERAGVSIGSLYQYFPGKQALLIALMRREKERFRDDASRSAGEPTMQAALTQLVAAAVRHKLVRPELARLLDLEEARPEAHREVGGASGYRTLVQTALERPGSAVPRADLIADDIVALVRLLVERARARGEPDSPALEHRIALAVLGYVDGASPGPAAGRNVSKKGGLDQPD